MGKGKSINSLASFSPFWYCYYTSEPHVGKIGRVEVSQAPIFISVSERWSDHLEEKGGAKW
jgi:hypothetical protein